MSTDGGYISFSGGSAEEAEDFIIAVKRRAYSKGKHDDNAWIAKFVSICLERKALRWYESLDEETQNDWKLLKRAILEKYNEVLPPPAIIPASAPTLQSSNQGSTPATVSPFRIRIGRIRVECDPSDLQGYISNKSDPNNCCFLSLNPAFAATFEFDALARTIKFQHSTGGYLAADFCRTNSAPSGSVDNNYRRLQRSSGVPIGEKDEWFNIIRVDLWSMGDENKLVGHLPLMSGASYGLKVLVNKTQRMIYLAKDLPQSAPLPNTLKPATLYLEPLS